MRADALGEGELSEIKVKYKNIIVKNIKDEITKKIPGIEVDEDIIKTYLKYTIKDLWNVGEKIIYKVSDLKMLIGRVSPGNKRKIKLINMLNNAEYNKLVVYRQRIEKQLTGTPFLKELDILIELSKRKKGLTKRTENLVSSFQVFEKVIKVDKEKGRIQVSHTITQSITELQSNINTNSKSINKELDKVVVFLDVLKKNGVSEKTIGSYNEQYIIILNNTLSFLFKKDINFTSISDIRIFIHNKLKIGKI